MTTLPDDPTADEAIAATRAWLRRAVIGLNLCPFAKAVEVRGQIRYVVSEAAEPDALLETLCRELALLAEADPDRIDTTLLIHPHVLCDFLDYNDFLDLADVAVAQLGYTGVLQVASFHPHYRFAGSAPDDIGNASNRSPYPLLHLLREASVARAVEAFPEAEAIYAANLRTLEALGAAGWARLQAAMARDAVEAGNADPSPR
jgi:hypothetical protein